MRCLTLALSGMQHAPRSGNLLLCVRDEQPVMQHWQPSQRFQFWHLISSQTPTNSLAIRS